MKNWKLLSKWQFDFQSGPGIAALSKLRCEMQKSILEQGRRGKHSRYNVMRDFNDMFYVLIFRSVFQAIRQLFPLESKTRAQRRKEIPFKMERSSKRFHFALKQKGMCTSHLPSGPLLTGPIICATASIICG